MCVCVSQCACVCVCVCMCVCVCVTHTHTHTHIHTGAFSQGNMVAPEDIKVYRRGRLVTEGRAFVLTSFYQVPTTVLTSFRCPQRS